MKSKEVVTFVDASQQAYGAASYLRCEYEDGTVSAQLIASKSKVAPLTPMTVPRLELMGAIVGLRLTQSVSRVLELPVKAASFYSDSTDVLWWVRGRGRDFRQTVLGRYILVLNRDSGSTSLPEKIPLICVPGEQAQVSFLNPNYGGVAQIG